MNTEEKSKLKELHDILVRKNDSEINPYVPVLASVVGQTDDMSVLKSLLDSTQWPDAVDPNLICDSESETDKISRAEGILELLVEKNLKDLAFLDFGCGEGHIPFKAITQEPRVSVGYDIVEDSHWGSFTPDEKLTFTVDLERVKSLGPYDVILIYDVLDHVSHDEVVNVLRTVNSLLADNGTVYLRTHPFSSRHATHLYHKLNKAFVHLVFSEAELQEMGYETPTNAKVVYPIAEYKGMITNAGLQITHNNVLREKVEAFFPDNPIIKERVRAHFLVNGAYPDPNIARGNFPTFQCEQQFIDYVLKKA